MQQFIHLPTQFLNQKSWIGINKKFKIFKYFQVNDTFPDDQRNSNSTFKKLRSEHICTLFFKKIEEKIKLSFKKLQTYLIVGLI